mgnify:CR=1 FL=1
MIKTRKEKTLAQLVVEVKYNPRLWLKNGDVAINPEILSDVILLEYF